MNSSRSSEYRRLRAAILISVLPTALAAAPEVASLEEVVVTAQKRSESVQDAAVSIAAFTEEDIERYRFQTLYDVAQATPNVHITTFYDVVKPDIAIRGLGVQNLYTNLDQPPVGIYQDEVFIGARTAQLAQMFDVERIEVLRGPQGTLYGRNTTAGAVNFYSRMPSKEFRVNGRITVGNYNALELEGGVDVPFSDTFSMRVAGINRHRDGYTKNEYASSTFPQGSQSNNVPRQDRLQGTDNWGVRAIFRWTPTESMEWVANLHSSQLQSTAPVAHSKLGQGHGEPNLFTGYVESSDWNTVSNDLTPNMLIEMTGANLRGTFDLGSDMTLTSITAYERADGSNQQDVDGTPYSIYRSVWPNEDQKQVSQEFRLARQSDEGLDWVVGAFYYQDSMVNRNVGSGFFDPVFSDGDPTIGDIPSFQTERFTTQDSENWAAFVDLKYPLPFAPALAVNAGTRYTKETKEYFVERVRTNGVDTPLTGQGTDASWEEVTWKLGLEWEINEDVLLYTSFSTGFKSGGYNAFPSGSLGELVPYEPETVEVFDFGIKSSLLDDRLFLNLGIFKTDVTDFQALVVIPDPLGSGDAIFTTDNAADAEIYGMELEAKAQITERWFLSAGLGLVKHEYGTFVSLLGDFSGQEFVTTPEITGTAVLEYAYPISMGSGMMQGSTLTPRVEFTHVGHQWMDHPQRPIIDEQEAYDVWNASLSWRSQDGSFEVSAWGKNLNNAEYVYKTIGNGVELYGGTVAYHAPPRTYGLTFNYSPGR